MSLARLGRRGLLATAAASALSPALAGRALAAPFRFSPVEGAALPGDYVGVVLIPRYYEQTGHNIDGPFLEYFRARGGLDSLGYPLTEQYWEPLDESGTDGRLAQYFQRARLEITDYGSVVRSPLGETLDRAQPPVEPDEDRAAPSIRHFPDTGHNVGGAFLRFFDDAGGTEALGLPISEEVEENGHTIQWFQNARLEWWPENPRGQQVLYGLIGEEALAEERRYVPAQARRRAEPLEPLRRWALPPPPAGPLARVGPLKVPILYYHEVPSPGPLREQIKAFRGAGYTFVRLGQVVDALRGEGTLPEKPLSMTFDDSWASQFTSAIPVLQAEDVPATFFIITRYLGTIRGYMTWDQVRTIKELGHEVESHTQNHPSLDLLRAQDEGAAVAEIWESLAILEDRLGHSKRLFAYPNGRLDAAVAALVGRVYRGAVATGGGPVQAQSQMYALNRIKAEPSYSADSLLKQMG